MPPGVMLFWILNTIGKVVLVPVALQRRRDYPAFCSYICFQVIFSAALWFAFLTSNNDLYIWMSWRGELLGDVFLLWVLVELGALLFAPLWIVPKPVMRCSLVSLALLFLAVITLWFWSPSTFPDRFFAVARMGDRAIAILFTGGLAVVYTCATILKIPWRRHAAGIAAGFAVYFLFNAVHSIISVSFDNRLYQAVQWVHMSGYLLAEGIWTVTLIGREKELYSIQPGDEKLLGKVAEEADQWERLVASGIC